MLDFNFDTTMAKNLAAKNREDADEVLRKMSVDEQNV